MVSLNTKKDVIADNNQTARDYSLDLIRIIAIMAVVMIHIASPFLVVYKASTTEFLFGNIFDSISRLGVPLFVMVSGALMLNENKTVTVKSIYRKNIFNIVVLFLFWSACYSVYNNVLMALYRGESIIVKKLLVNLVTGNYHMWFLYMIIGLYVITPILRCFVKEENSNIVLYFICISLLFNFLKPLISYMQSIWEPFKYIRSFIGLFEIHMMGGFVTYYLLGWYIINIGFSKTIKKCVIILGFISLLITVLAIYNNPLLNDTIYSNMNILTLFYSSAAFIIIHSLYSLKMPLNKIIYKMSKLSFGIYIIHIFIVSIFNLFYPYTGNLCLIYILLQWFVVFTLSALVTYVMSKIPIIKKLVKG